MIEKLGFVAACAVAASFFMNGERTLRMTNIVGSILFVIYGTLIGSRSIAFLNIVSICANLIKMPRKGKQDETT